MSHEPGDLDDFFRRYADVALSDVPRNLAALYAPMFIAAGPEGSQAFANDDRFLDWLKGVRDFNRTVGMTSLQVRDIHASELSPIHALAVVRWGSTFESTGDRVIEFDITYLLEQSSNSWVVLAYVSREDQQAAMKREGLL